MATSKKTTVSKAQENTEEVLTEVSKSEPEVKQEVKEVKAEKKKIIPKDVDPNQYIVVKNGFNGVLVYISPRTHEKFLWERFGDEQEIELRELRNAKSSAKKFFENNWFMFNDEDMWVVDYLGLGMYYKNALSINGFDDLFTKSPAEISSIISKLSNGQKRSVSYRARKLINDGEIDSMKVITALEKSLGIELVER